MHQLDFWIGEWEVRSREGPAGTSSIESVLGGCALIKKLSSDKGETSLTVIFYDPATGKWNENGTTSNGDIWEATGELREGDMHFFLGYVRSRTVARCRPEHRWKCERKPRPPSMVRLVGHRSTT